MTQSVIVEIRPRLQVCNVFLIMKEDLPKEDTVQINVKTSGVDVRWLSETGETVQVIDLHNYKLKPLSLSGLHIQKNSVSFRIQTEPAVNTSGSFASEILPFDKTLDIMSSDPELLSPNIPCGEPCSLACKCCGKLISKQGLSFSRVLPLPSTGELDNSDWFCHKHSSLPAPTLAPKDNDCFYGLCFILLSTLILNISPKRVLRCSRCLAWLGTCDSSTAKLWSCTTSYEGSSTSTPLEDFILTVKNAFNNTFGITCRVMLEVKLSDKDSQYLLLWAMDKNLDVLVSGGEDEFTSVKEKQNI
ncbi:hypothetical protein ANN_05693 [Periplaneta americana]|uniref:E3 ubiquitin-protein ligase E3D n=1 Tax=Periplaneta americana TaxID=6978 RepID=A0ABQ8TBI0_PERAM|nr:hypothetical protein ANN_05693 [Periplaneta americana]